MQLRATAEGAGAPQIRICRGHVLSSRNLRIHLFPLMTQPILVRVNLCLLARQSSKSCPRTPTFAGLGEPVKPAIGPEGPGGLYGTTRKTHVPPPFDRAKSDALPRRRNGTIFATEIEHCVSGPSFPRWLLQSVACQADI
ncbi:hypothetical protein BKA81DRAFT_356062 [Phyllosticta paracitricarpa]